MTETVGGWTRSLKRLGACDDAIEWARTQPDLATAWAKCERADWLMWLIAKTHDDRKFVVSLAVDCARTALTIYEKRYPNDKRVRNCLNVTKRWTRDRATIEEVREARREWLYSAAAADAAANAAAAAADAAANAAANAAAAAAYAANAAAANAANAAAANARLKSHKRMCAMIRRRAKCPEVT